MPIAPRDYYSFAPTREQQTGDIWSGLPTFGILPSFTSSGIVISPACDLENCKTEMITYLPIVPIRSFLRGSSIIRTIKTKLIGLLEAERRGVAWENDSTLPPLAQLTEILDEMRAIDETRRNAKLDRCLHMLVCLKEIAEGRGDAITLDDLNAAFGPADYGKLRDDTLRNRRSDTHFLPRDDEPAELSAVPEHSVALFRYALSAPIEIFETANLGEPGQWGNRMRSIQVAFAVAEFFRHEMPLKRARLESTFLSDLLTRYAGTYVRLGSPDFSEHQILAFAGEES